tara:strand:+ start:1080 stop:1682 length:603 start_codon:yes stop_codon:yes gene_type:complete
MFYKGPDPLKIYIVHIDNITDPREGIIYIKSPYNEPIDHQRVYIPQLLGVDKFIFLDSDTIIMTCMYKLWSIDMNSKALLACPSYHIKTLSEMYDIYDIPTHDVVDLNAAYFNIGVMVIDSLAWDRMSLTQAVKASLNLYQDCRCSKIAEPAYNIALYNKWHEIDESWNYHPRDFYKKVNILHYYGQNFGKKPRHVAFIR